MRALLTTLLFSSLLFIGSCTGGVSDDIKGAALGLNIAKSLYKFPHVVKEEETQLYQELSDVFEIKVTETIKNKDGTTTIKGEVSTEDNDRAQGIILALMMGGGIKKDVSGAVKRAVAAIDAELGNSHKPQAKSQRFELTYTEKDGKEVVTKFKNLK